MIRWKIIVINLVLLSSISSIGLAQVYVFAGFQKNYIRSKVLLNALPLTSWHFGGGANVLLSADRKKLSLAGEAAFVRKGYYQTLGNQKADWHFDYLTFQGTARYRFVNFFSIEGGLNVGVLVYSNMDKWIKTYNIFDLSVAGGLSFLEKNRVGFYTRMVYGLTPMVSYERPDEVGNFHGTFHDLRNMCVMVGLRVMVYGKKELSFKH